MSNASLYLETHSYSFTNYDTSLFLSSSYNFGWQPLGLSSGLEDRLSNSRSYSSSENNSIAWELRGFSSNSLASNNNIFISNHSAWINKFSTNTSLVKINFGANYIDSLAVVPFSPSSVVNLGSLNRVQTISDFVGTNNAFDIYRFSLVASSSLNISLNGLSSNADLALFDSNGTQIATSTNSGITRDWLDGSLNAGTYYVRVTSYSGNTNYRLGLSANALTNNGATRTISGTLDANVFTYQSSFSRTVISGNGNLEFGTGVKDVLNLSNINSNSVSFNLARTSGGGVAYNSGNGTRIFDALTLSDGNQILFEGLDSIQFANGTLNLSEVPNDPFFGEQWNLHMMGVHNAWRFTKGSSSVLVGVQDSGLGLSASGAIHGDLRDTWIYRNNYSDDFGTNSTSHGTSVQGIIAAASNNGIGMSGINWNSDVVNIDVLGGESTDQSLAAATENMINLAAQNGQRLVINMSLGYNSFGQTGIEPDFERVVANNPNVLFVIAAGNSGHLGIEGLAYPAALAAQYRNVMAIGASWGAVDQDGYARSPGSRIEYGWWGSQYGNGLTMMGPSEVIATAANSSGQFSYSSQFNGTSAATPNVTGVASLVWSVNPYLTGSQVKQVMAETAYDLGTRGYDAEYGSGFTNADAAVRRAMALARGYA